MLVAMNFPLNYLELITKTVMNAAFGNIEPWFESLADKALDRNNKSTCIWNKYKDDLEETKKILDWLPNKLKYGVMVPIGPKAFMRGKIVHTNELLVNLGETWFVKKTARDAVEICDRRITNCNEMLDRLTKERELIENKKLLPAEKEAFGSEERPEIVEYVTEEEHEEWKKQHRIKEKEYRKKLAEMRNEKRVIVTEEDLWNHLDDLELQEELEDELNRLHMDDDTNEESSDTDEDVQSSTKTPRKIPEKCNDSKSISDSAKYEKPTEKEFQNVDASNVEIKKSKPKVSFSLSSDNSSECEPLRLEIKHSSNEPAPSFSDGTMNSPSDIYNSYVKSLVPQSILKKTAVINKEREFDSLSETDNEGDVSNCCIGSGVVLSDVFERSMSNLGDCEKPLKNKFANATEPRRKMSKFRESRMKSTNSKSNSKS